MPWYNYFLVILKTGEKVIVKDTYDNFKAKLMKKETIMLDSEDTDKIKTIEIDNILDYAKLPYSTTF